MNNTLNYIQKGLLLLGAIAILSACDKEKHLAGGELTQQSATLEVVVKDKAELANPFSLRAIEVASPEVKSTTVSLRVHLALPAEQETPFTIKVDEEAAKQYAKGSAKLLPGSLIDIPKEITPISEGSVTSNPVGITIGISNELEYDEVYTFALRLSPIPGMIINAPNDVVVYTLVRRENKVQITEAVLLTRDFYFEPVNKFKHQGDFTMECLVNVQKFRSDDDPGEAQISTLMGVEGGTLLRFGDSGLPGNRLQAAGEAFRDNPFSTNAWYHIAFTYKSETRTVTVYIDGKQVGEFTKSCSLLSNGEYPWYIGKSYSDGRGIQAFLSEVRVWKSCRTASEIQGNMFETGPADANLLAYWKMNSAEGEKVPDATGNGYDLTLKAQLGSVAPKVNVVTLDKPLDSVDK